MQELLRLPLRKAGQSVFVVLTFYHYQFLKSKVDIDGCFFRHT